MSRPFIAACFVVAFVAALSGCRAEGDSDGGGGEDCADIGGDWFVGAHCEPDLVGVAVGVEQSGCTFETSGAFDQFSGTIDEAGSVVLGGVAYEGGPHLDCAGTGTFAQIILECDSDCHVELARPQ